VLNRAKEAAPIHLLPTLWIRNFWSFREMKEKPLISMDKDSVNSVDISHEYVGDYHLYFETPDHLLFTENETNRKRVYGDKNDHPYKKDLFHDAVINSNYSLATKRKQGTKFAPHYQRELAAGESTTVRLRLSKDSIDDPFGEDFEAIIAERQKECDSFYKKVGGNCDGEELMIQKQAFAGMLWTKQYYNYEVERWLEGDKKNSIPPPERWTGRNHSWKTLRSHDIMLMPDAWEYPWYAAWDSAFHCVTMAMIDPEFAKKQLLLFTKEWYMKPNGQIPAYEWSFSDVNPPVQAWAAIEIYEIEKRKTGKGDIKFLKRMFNKLALNFTWWVNRLDSSQKNVFEGGFLGLDNIGVFDRSTGIPGGGILEQVDGTSWMALYCLNMLEMSLEIAMEDDAYEDMATKYFGHFVFIAEALNKRSQENVGTWDEEQGFFYDKLILPDGRFVPIKVRSIAGMLSLAAVLCIKKHTLDKLPKFKASVGWFKRYRMETMKFPVIQEYVDGDDLLLSLVPKDRMPILVKVMLDESEFLSPFGIRSLSKKHEQPYSINIDGNNYSINYEPAESSVPLFGGNSNWRGPVWFPMNYLFINALREYHSYGGENLKFQYPTGSGKELNLEQIAQKISNRLVRIFKADEQGERAVNGLYPEQYSKEHFKDYILFYEYFHGDNGRGVGSSHQTGWTALVANLIADIHKDD
ncbi:MAG: glucosidase, partial [Flavobacteriaceae bacterium]|nr:glucosidase [Flavobacteriaceae bacterium]